MINVTLTVWKCENFLLEGDYIIPVGRDKILSRFAEIRPVL